MNRQEQALYGVPIKTPRVLLERLDALARRREAGEDIPLPVIVLHLPGGRDLKGSVVRLFKDAPRENVLLLHVVGENLHQPRYDLAYLDPDRVEAITVLDANESATALGSGALPEPKSSEPPPSRLEVLRKMDEMATALTSTSGWSFQPLVDPAPEQGPQWRQVAALGEQTFAVLGDILRDTLAVDTLKKLVQKVRFSSAPMPAVAVGAGTLDIKTNFEKGFEGRLSTSALKAAIEKAL